MELHLEQGDEVTMITCDAAFSFCEANQERDFLICAQCIGRAQEGLKHLSSPVNVIRLSELMLEAKAAPEEKLDSYALLRTAQKVLTLGINHRNRSGLLGDSVDCSWLGRIHGPR